MEGDRSGELADTVRDSKGPLAIHGGNSKLFYGREVIGSALDIRPHSGVVQYDPAELVVTVRAGTRLHDLESLLAENGQQLGFEPPAFSGESTIGGVIAAGLAGPCRPYSGSVEDFVLGVKILSGSGQVMQFGGRVIKNVAGFDVSRLMVGALGCLGVILEVSLKVVPRPAREATLLRVCENATEAADWMNQLAASPLPLTAACWLDGVALVRLSGSELGVASAIGEIGGELDEHGADFWEALRNQTHEFFTSDAELLKCSVSPSTPAFSESQRQLIEWGGAQRWFVGDGVAQQVIENTSRHRGHVTRFRHGNRDEDVFPAQPHAIMKLHERLKDTFDPDRKLNPGRLYASL